MKSLHPLTFGAIAIALALPALRSSEPEKMVVIIANDSLKFSVTRIDAAAGQMIHVQLRDEGSVPKASMGHNWILLQKDAQALPYAAAALTAAAADYQPPALASQVIASIKLLGARQVGDVVFAAPAEAGSYPFICSFPGHAMAGMRGELIVK